MITDSIRKAKYAYYQNTISKTGAQVIFKPFRQIQHKRTSSLKTSIDSDTFNKYFASIATVLSDKLPDSSKKFLPPREIQSFYLTPVPCSYIDDLITHMKPKNSCGLDTIPIKLIKLASPIVTPFLTKLIKDCIKYGIFPKCLKRSRVIPLYKSGDVHDPSNYRPISLLSCISKIFEKVLKAQLYQYFIKFNILNDSQFGF